MNKLPLISATLNDLKLYFLAPVCMVLVVEVLRVVLRKWL